MPRLHRLFPFLNWPRPDAALMRGEALAGLTVGMVAIPQGVAYAALAGMPLITGLYVSLLPALVAVLWGASTRVSVGTSALTALLVGASLPGLAEPGSAQWVELAVWLALLSGGLQIVLGLARFGWLLNLVSAPVMMAFTQGAVLLIAASQLPALLGLSQGWAGLMRGEFPDVGALGFGLGAVAALLLSKRLRPTFPTVLVVVGVSAALSVALGFESAGGRVIGSLPQGLPTLYLPGWPGWEVLGSLLLPTLVIALVSFLETAASAKVDNELQGRRWDQDQDLIGHGMAKLAAAFSGGFPTGTSFSRSALLLYAGARSGWTTVVAVLVVLLGLVLLTPMLHHVPLAVLAAIVVVAVMGLFKPVGFVRLWAVSRVEAAIAGITFAVTVLAAPRLYWGVLAGVLMALSHFLYLRLHPRIIEVGLHADGSLRDRHLWQLATLAPHMVAMRMDAALDFATVNAFERQLAEHLTTRPDTRHVMLIAHPINWVDATGVEAFGRVQAQLADRGITLHLVGIKLPVETLLRAAGHLRDGPGLRLYRTETEALKACAVFRADEEWVSP